MGAQIERLPLGYLVGHAPRGPVEDGFELAVCRARLNPYGRSLLDERGHAVVHKNEPQRGREEHETNGEEENPEAILPPLVGEHVGEGTRDAFELEEEHFAVFVELGERVAVFLYGCFDGVDLELETLLFRREARVLRPVVDGMTPRAREIGELHKTFVALFTPVVEQGKTVLQRLARGGDLVLERLDGGQHGVLILAEFRGVLPGGTYPRGQEAEDHGDRGDGEDVPQDPGDRFSDESHGSRKEKGVGAGQSRPEDSRV